VILTEDEDMVEDLSPECADKPLSKGIHVRRAYRRDHRDIQNSIWFDCKALGRVLGHIARADA